MESSSSSSSTATTYDLDNLPRETCWGGREFVQWEGFWYRQAFLEAAMAARSNFKARDDDVIIASSMETGTTWLKAIIPCIINNSSADPKDVFVSLWHFMNSKLSVPFPLNEAFDDFCRGVHSYGPFHDQVLGYWQESLKRPEKILSLKYEHLENDPSASEKLAAFLGRPFANDEQVENLLWKCSLERLKNLEINRNNGADPHGMNSAYFRLGLVGDWKNQLSVEMKERLDKITKMKLEGSRLDL